MHQEGSRSQKVIDDMSIKVTSCMIAAIVELVYLEPVSVLTGMAGTTPCSPREGFLVPIQWPGCNVWQCPAH